VSVLPACADVAALQEGKYIHEYIMKNKFELDIFVGNSLLSMYAKCKRIDIALQLFDKMSKKNVISWNSMIAGYTQNGLANEALSIFHEMQLSGTKPNAVTMVSVVLACARLAALQQGKCFHAYIIKCVFDLNVVLETTLIDMYAKCGKVEIARQMFDNISRKNVVSWTAMIGGYAMHGLAEDAHALFI
jgi:pentatricopeptide repeat protein